MMSKGPSCLEASQSSAALTNIVYLLHTSFFTHLLNMGKQNGGCKGRMCDGYLRPTYNYAAHYLKIIDDNPRNSIVGCELYSTTLEI